jgi:hypothetical protein
LTSGERISHIHRDFFPGHTFLHSLHSYISSMWSLWCLLKVTSYRTFSHILDIHRTFPKCILSCTVSFDFVLGLF